MDSEDKVTTEGHEMIGRPTTAREALDHANQVQRDAEARRLASWQWQAEASTDDDVPSRKRHPWRGVVAIVLSALAGLAVGIMIVGCAHFGVGLGWAGTRANPDIAQPVYEMNDSTNYGISP